MFATIIESLQTVTVRGLWSMCRHAGSGQIWRIQEIGKMP